MPYWLRNGPTEPSQPGTTSDIADLLGRVWHGQSVTRYRPAGHGHGVPGVRQRVPAGLLLELARVDPEGSGAQPPGALLGLDVGAVDHFPAALAVGHRVVGHLLVADVGQLGLTRCDHGVSLPSSSGRSVGLHPGRSNWDRSGGTSPV